MNGWMVEVCRRKQSHEKNNMDTVGSGVSIRARHLIALRCRLLAAAMAIAHLSASSRLHFSHSDSDSQCVRGKMMECFEMCRTHNGHCNAHKQLHKTSNANFPTISSQQQNPSGYAQHVMAANF